MKIVPGDEKLSWEINMRLVRKRKGFLHKIPTLKIRALVRGKTLRR
jgi:hypothetical protein